LRRDRATRSRLCLRLRSHSIHFAALDGLELRPQTELFLGLIHLTDGLEGARRRMAAADTVVTDYGVATECGFGRRPPHTILPLLDLHRTVAQQSPERR
jgi:hypothetical protein